MHSFYIELSSNATVFDNNTVANFINRIQLLESLQGHWEAGLVEISYTRSWRNLQDNYVVSMHKMTNNISVSFIEHKTKLKYPPVEGDQVLGIVRSGYYESAEDLAKEIEKQFTKLKNDDIEYLFKIKFDEYTTLTYIIPGKYKDGSLLIPKFNDEINHIFGFDTVVSTYPYTQFYNYIISNKPADINAGLQTLYVYCDLVEPQYIGDIRAKLLRTVEVPNNVGYGNQVVLRYEMPHYVPILSNEFESIEIDIKDDTNTRIPFYSVEQE